MRPRHKILAVTLVIVLLASCTASYFIGKASWTGNLESLPWYAGGPDAYSYKVETNSTHYFMFNGTTGNDDFVSINMTQVFNNLIGNTTTGGTLLFGLGIFAFDYPELISHSIYIQGQGKSVDNTYGTVFDLGANGYFNISSTANLDGIGFSGIYWDGTHTSKAITTEYMAAGMRVRELSIKDCRFEDFDYQDNGRIIVGKNTELWKIENNDFVGINGTMILFYDDGYDYGNNWIENNVFYLYDTTGNDVFSSTAINVLENQTAKTAANINSYFNQYYGTNGQSMQHLAINITVTAGTITDFTSVGDRTENCEFLSVSAAANYTKGGKVTAGDFYTSYAGKLITIGVNSRDWDIYNNRFERGGVGTVIGIEDNVTSTVYFTTIEHNRFTYFPVGSSVAIDPTSATVMNDNINYNYDDSIYDYVVSTDGTTYYAEEGRTGYVYSSTNASEVFDSVLTNGHTIYVTDGTYSLTSNIEMRNNTALIGENPYTTILVNERTTAQGYTGGLIENYNHNESVGEAEANWNKDYNITISGIGMEGQGSDTAGFAIGFIHVDNVILRNLRIRDFRSDCINFNGLSVDQGGRGQGNGTTYGLTIEDVSIEKAGVDALALNAVYNFDINGINASYVSQVGSGTNNGWGITLAGSCAYGHISNFIIQHSSEIVAGGQGSGGMHIINAKWVTFSDGFIANMNGTGIYAESAGSYNPQWLEFDAVQVINCTSENWFFKNGYDITVIGGLGENAGYGSSPTNNFNNMYFYNTERCRVIGLELRDNQASHTTYNGIYEDTLSASNIFMGISIFGCSNSTGIYLLGAGTVNSTIICNP